MKLSSGKLLFWEWKSPVVQNVQAPSGGFSIPRTAIFQNSNFPEQSLIFQICVRSYKETDENFLQRFSALFTSHLNHVLWKKINWAVSFSQRQDVHLPCFIDSIAIQL
jgi:hypothetical protein